MIWYWLFIKEKTNQYIVLSDNELNLEGRWMLEDDNYELISDCQRSRKAAQQYAEQHYGAKKLKFRTKPVNFKEACNFVNLHHRHHVSPQGHKFSVALFDGDIVIGIIIAGRPVSRFQDDGYTLEITRCCVKSVYKNSISRLYAATCRIAKEFGFKRVITYTLTKELGTSMLASNFLLGKKSSGGSWNSKTRKRIDKHPLGTKYLWTKQIV
ncbi:hypothetical protein BTS2_3297 [Bacillus sp. TS-2]|nr:hypothetical protein BTS2_3297 [Bacillus sp. TS-2]